MAEKVLKAVGLQAQNTMRLRAVSLTFDPAQNIYVIGGENAQGKSTVLNVIAMLLGGRRLDPPQVVRVGEEEAVAELPLDDGHVIRGRWKPGAPGQIEVLSPDGVPLKAPQSWLNERISKHTFDPVAFESMKEDAQVAEVTRALGLDFSELDKEYEEKFSARTVVGRERDRATARLSALPKLQDVAPIDTSSLLKKQEELLEQQRERNALASAARETAVKRDSLKQEGQTVKSALEQMETELTALQQRIANARLQRQGLEDRWKKAAEDARKAQTLAEQAPDPDMELTMLRSQLEEAEKNTEAALKARERVVVAAELKASDDEYKALTKRLDLIEIEKAKALKEANFPVPGLSFSGSRLLLNSLPFSQASQAERLRVSVALGLLSKPEIRILLVREGSRLDKKSLKLLAEIAAEYDAQVFLEVVGSERSGPMIVIEDGAVSEVRT
jgi:energy-coupling factor transporter ATP-binding protein EcfA2